MRLLEYQGKDVFRRAGLAVPQARLLTVESPGQCAEAVRTAAGELLQTGGAEHDAKSRQLPVPDRTPRSRQLPVLPGLW